MDNRTILSEIDKLIASLQQAKALLLDTMAVNVPAKRGRPKNSKRRLSAEGRAAISAAIKRRWAERSKK